MAPFINYSRTRTSRLRDGSYGVYYAGDSFDVALRETVHHFERFMRATDEPPAMADCRKLIGRIDADLHDIRRDAAFAACLDPDDYGPGQALARRLRDGHGSNGIVYPSVRCPGGDAVAAFWPDIAGLPVQGRHLCYRWNGARADACLIYGQPDWTPL